MTLLDLVQQDRLCTPRRTRPTEYHTGCFACGGEDRFIVWADTGRYWCRQCNLRGDAVEYARRARGLSFREAAALAGKELPETERQRRARERAVKERLLNDYFLWSHRRLEDACAQFRGLCADLAEAEIGYRATVRRPDLYSDAEKAYWEQFLGSVYDALPSVEQDCDLLTYDAYLRERFLWWEEERGGCT